MDMAAWLDEMNYRLLVCAADGAEAAKRVAVIARWASAQGERLGAGQSPISDSEGIVADAIADGGDRDCPHKRRRATRPMSA